MKIDNTGDLECRYKGIMDYITSLKERVAAEDTIPDMIRMFAESERELLSCSKRDWPIIKQAQSHMGTTIAKLLVENTYKCPIEEYIKKSADPR